MSVEPTPQRPPFVRGSDTSKAASRSLDSAYVTGLEAVVLMAVRDSPMGLTDDAIEAATGLTHQTASARRNALVRKGLVCDSGERARTRSGRKAVVWVIGQGEPLEGAANERAPRPTNAEIREAEAYIGDRSRDDEDADWPEPETIKKLRRWLRHIAR